jgi:predicted CopG family antitoxin
MKTTETMTITLSKEVAKKLKQWAIKENRSYSNAIETLIKKQLYKNKLGGQNE